MENNNRPAMFFGQQMNKINSIESAKIAIIEFCKFASENEIENTVKELKSLSSKDKDTYNVINKFLWLLHLNAEDGTILSRNSFKLLNAAFK